MAMSTPATSQTAGNGGNGATNASASSTSASPAAKASSTAIITGPAWMTWGFEESMRRTLWAAYAILVLQRFRDGAVLSEGHLAGVDLILDVELPAVAAEFEAGDEDVWRKARRESELKGMKGWTFRDLVFHRPIHAEQRRKQTPPGGSQQQQQQQQQGGAFTQSSQKDVTASSTTSNAQPSSSEKSHPTNAGIEEDEENSTETTTPTTATTTTGTGTVAGAVVGAANVTGKNAATGASSTTPKGLLEFFGQADAFVSTVLSIAFCLDSHLSV